MSIRAAMPLLTRIVDSWAWIALVAVTIATSAITMISIGAAAQAPGAVLCLAVFAASHVVERITHKANRR